MHSLWLLLCNMHNMLESCKNIKVYRYVQSKSIYLPLGRPSRPVSWSSWFPVFWRECGSEEKGLLLALLQKDCLAVKRRGETKSFISCDPTGGRGGRGGSRWATVYVHSASGWVKKSADSWLTLFNWLLLCKWFLLVFFQIKMIFKRLLVGLGIWNMHGWEN